MSTLKSRTGRIVAVAARGTCIAVALLVGGAALVSVLDRSSAKVSQEADDDDAKPTVVRPAGHERVVQLDRNAQAKSGIETATPTPIVYQDTVRAYGTVLPLDRLTALYNASLTDAAQLQAATTKLNASRTSSERAKNLLKVFSTAKAQAETAEAAYELDASGVAAAKAQIEALRNTAIQDWGPVLGASIAERSGLADDLVHRRTVLIQVSPQPATVVTPPLRLTFALGRSAPVEGRLVSDAAQIDPKMQSAGYFYAVPAAPGLVPGTSVLADLPKGDAQPGLDIPSAAIVWQAGKPWLYLRNTADSFQRYKIDASAAPTREGGYVVPAATVPHDHAVVVAGAQVLLSQEMRDQIPSDEDDN